MRISCMVLALLATGCAAVCPEGTEQVGDRCLSELGPRGDGGRTDAGPPLDAGPIDSGPDAGPVDGGPVDGGPVDGGPVDSGPPIDGGPPIDAGPETCPGDSRCIPPAPSDWMGPFSVGEGAVNAPPCPGSYPTEEATLFRGLTVPPASCSCGCSVTGTTCELQSTISGNSYIPASSCDDPPMEDDCLEAVAESNCNPTPATNVPPLGWAARARSCAGTRGASCGGGSCYPAAASGQRLCIARPGDHTCPAPFADRTLYNTGATDSRDCSACTCSTSGAACTIQIEVCSVGFYTEDLSSAAGDEACLPPASDGDGVSLLTTNINSMGSCSTSGGTAVGSAAPSGPMTYCCLF